MSDAVPPALPDDVVWRLQKAEGYLDLKLVDRALHELTHVPLEHQSSTPYRTLRARLAFAQHDWTLAAELSRALRDENPSDAGLWINLAFAVRRCVGIDAAKEVLLEAVNRFPSEALIPFNLACYECRLGRNDLARVWLEKAFAIEPAYRETAQDDDDLRPLWPELEA